MLSILAITLLAAASASAQDCGSFGGPGRTVDWHANTDGQFNGGDAGGICGCLEGLVNIESCKLEYAFPDGKSAWGRMTYCKGGKNQLESETTICFSGGGGGWILQG